MDDTANGATGRIQIRVRNDSNLDFDRVRVEFPDEHDVDYGAVPPGGVSPFRPITRAYRYAGVSVTSADRELSFHPIDYLGESLLPAGRYTYVLDVDGGQLTVHLDEQF